jgi:hypothetical protein
VVHGNRTMMLVNVIGTRHAENPTEQKNRAADLLPPRFADTFACA